MSKRLQVVVDDREMRSIRRDAQRHGMSVSEWVRKALRDARRQSSSRGAAHKLAAVRAGARHSFPTGDIAQMLDEIERGYLNS